MAESPAHQFGQMIGHFLEDAMRPVLQDFCAKRGLYLDAKGKRAGVRKGSKVTWTDRYGNQHDLDFVIEKEGSEHQQGRPVAFIEVAWRRYTKHSRNKAQEIQAAILPVAEEHQWDRPFIGAVLAGVFTQASIEQLQSFGFSTLYFEYEAIVLAFKEGGVDVRFDEATTDQQFSDCIQKIKLLGDAQYMQIMDYMLRLHQEQVDAFMDSLGRTLDRLVERLVVIPLHGAEHVFSSCAEAIGFIMEFDQRPKAQEFRKYEIMVKFSNGDQMEASFKDKEDVERFLRYLSS